MGAKNIYVADEDEHIFDKAKVISGGLSNSQLVLTALKEYIANRETEVAEIQIKIGDETMTIVGKKL